MAGLSAASMVGRVEELGLLRQLVADAARRRPRVAIVLGEAGIGKTRLVDELIGPLGRVVVARGSCSPGVAGDLPLAPVAEVLASLRRALGPGFGRLAGGGADTAVAALLPELAGGAPGARVSSQAQLFDSVVRLLRDVGRSRPLVMVMEDVHWADQTSRDLLEFFARSLRDEQIVLVLTARTQDPAFESCSELVANLGALRHGVRVTLPRLTSDEVAEQVRGLRGSDPAMAEVGPDGGVDDARVFALSEGVPLLVEEVVHADLDDVGSLADLLLGHRLGRLSPAARAVVESAAVATVESSTDALARTSLVAPDAFDGAFGEAIAGGVLVRRQSGGQALVGFRHALLREATLARIMPNAERDLHRRWSAELGENPTGLGELVAAAHHRHRSGDLGGALDAYYRAAMRSEQLSAYAEEKQLLLRAAELWPQVHDAEARTGTILTDVYGQAAWCANLLMADPEEGQRLLDAALAALPPDATAHKRGMLALLWHRLRRNTGDHLSIGEVLAAVAAVETEPPSEEAVIAAMEAADAVRRFGDPGAAEAHARRAVSMAELVGATGLTARALSALSATLTGHEDVEAVRAAERAVVLADRTGDLFARTDALFSCRHARWMVAQPTAFEIDKRLVELLGGDRPGPMPGRWGLAQLWHADGLIETGRWDEATAVLDLVRTADPLPGWLVATAQQLADHLAVRRGDAPAHLPEGPDEQVAEAVEVDLDDRLFDAYVAADIAARLGDLTRARAHIASAVGDDGIAGKPAWLYQLLWVGARVEAEIATGATQPAPQPASRPVSAPAGRIAQRIRDVLEMAPPSNRRNLAYASHALADLDRREGVVRPETWEAVVSCWRDAALPFPLATALVRGGADLAASGRPKEAQAHLVEAVAIAVLLGARPLIEEALALARRWHIRVRATDGGPAPLGLTARELEVLRLLAEGASNGAIARTLVISPKTASVHVSNILAKLDVPNRAAAGAVAHRAGPFSGSPAGGPVE